MVFNLLYVEVREKSRNVDILVKFEMNAHDKCNLLGIIFCQKSRNIVQNIILIV